MQKKLCIQYMLNLVRHRLLTYDYSFEITIFILHSLPLTIFLTFETHLFNLSKIISFRMLSSKVGIILKHQ